MSKFCFFSVQPFFFFCKQFCNFPQPRSQFKSLWTDLSSFGPSYFGSDTLCDGCRRTLELVWHWFAYVVGVVGVFAPAQIGSTTSSNSSCNTHPNVARCNGTTRLGGVLDGGSLSRVIRFTLFNQHLSHHTLVFAVRLCVCLCWHIRETIERGELTRSWVRDHPRGRLRSLVRSHFSWIVVDCLVNVARSVAVYSWTLVIVVDVVVDFQRWWWFGSASDSKTQIFRTDDCDIVIFWLVFFCMDW